MAPHRFSGFDDSTWATGNAKLGYGGVGGASILSFGLDPTNKHITTYFRNDFSVVDAAKIAYLNLELLRDDGAVVYINGHEVLRSNMPNESINAVTLAETSVEQINENAFISYKLSPSVLMDGANVIAVEIHQASTTSSDMGFDFKLTATQVGTVPDTTSPAISNISAIFDNTSSIIFWNTDEAATSLVEYGSTPTYGSSSALGTILVTNHSRNLTGLSPGTTYHYRIISIDAAGNTAFSADNIFTTPPVADTTPPVISSLQASNITTSSAVITWTSDEAATSQVEYGTTTAYGSTTTLDSTLLTAHSQTLSGLSPSTRYHYRVRTADGIGNISVSSDYTFTTSTFPDTTPPGDIQKFTATVGDRQITLTWTNPPEADFIGVRIRYKTDGFPVDGNDGTLIRRFYWKPE